MNILKVNELLRFMNQDKWACVYAIPKDKIIEFIISHQQNIPVENEILDKKMSGYNEVGGFEDEDFNS